MKVGITEALLDNPVWHALTGPRAHLGRRSAKAAVFDPEVAVFAALPDVADQEAWDELATLTEGSGLAVLVRSPAAEAPAPWKLLRAIPCVQMVAPGPPPGPAPEAATPLTADDVPEMLELIAATKPGPFAVRTIEFGGYIGVRRDGRLIAMAGERLRLDGFTEISAVCTDPSCRGEGLATGLVTELMHRFSERDERPMLHAAADNVSAIRVYEKLGFEIRRHLDVMILGAR